MIAININRFCIENDFMFIEGLSDLTFFSVKITKITRMKIDFFLIFVFSFDVIDAAYINSVIIPDENVMITTNGSHLDMHSL
jgi:hypothetical protein